MKYIKIWWIFTTRTAQIAFESRLGVIIFTLGKLLRFGLHAFFLVVLVSNTKTLAGYSLWEVLLFFATFNFIDTTTQFALREVYRFRRHIISGYFDYILLWPKSPLFKSLFGGSDVIDMPLMLISVCFIVIAAGHVEFTTMSAILYMLFLINALVIALAFHILVLSLGVVTTEIDNTLWMYRDLTQMGRVPVDIYHQPIKGIITFIIPIGIMMTFPVKGLLGILNIPLVLVSFGIGVLFITVSLYFWKYSLRHYSSASS